jgi:hypothetical protein
MGKPSGSHVPLRRSESIGPPGELREVNHLSTGRKRKKFDSVSSGERTRNSPNPKASGSSGVVGQGPDRIRGVTKRTSRGTAWNGRPQRVKAPYPKDAASPGPVPEYHGARETLWESGRTISQG